MSSRMPGPGEDVPDVLVGELDRLVAADHEEAVAARAERDDHVREDRAERPDVVEELVDGPAVRGPLHHHPARVQVGGAGLVVLERRDDRRAGALDRWRRVRDDDVVALRRQLEVVPAVGDEDVAVGLREDLRRRPGRTSRTSSGRTGRARRRPSGGPRSPRPGTPSPSRTRPSPRSSNRAGASAAGSASASRRPSGGSSPSRSTNSCLPIVSAGLDRGDLVLRGLVDVRRASLRSGRRTGRRTGSCRRHEVDEDRDGQHGRRPARSRRG